MSRNPCSSCLSSLLMAQQIIDNFFKPNQPLQLHQFAQRVFQARSQSFSPPWQVDLLPAGGGDDFRPNLDGLRGTTYVHWTLQILPRP